MTYIRITNWVLQTASEWTASIQVLHTWEAGLESDTGKMKRGNGLDVYSALSYLPGFGGGGGGGDMLAANNLSDVANLQTSRQNLLPSFAGNAGKYIRINALEDDIEYITLAGGGDMLSANNLSDVANPVTALANLGISGTDISNWNAAFGWGNHALAGYLTAESDPVFVAWLAGPPNVSEFTNDAGYLTSFTETDPVFTTWLGTNDYLSSSTTSVQNGYLNSLNLKDQQTPSHYLHITVEDNLTATRNLEINVADGNKLLVISGNADISGNHSGNSSGTNTGDQTSIAGISGTKAEFDAAVSDGNFLYVGDITQYTDEMVDDRVSSLMQNGIAQTWTYDDTANTLTPKPNPVYNIQLSRYNINTFMHY